MPNFSSKAYVGPPPWQFNGHLQTILPAFRSIQVPYQRQRIPTADGDFLDIDCLRRRGNERLVILTHGLEGDSSRPYVSGAARFFSERNWDVMAWMCRSCSGEINRRPKLYSHGQSEDLATVVDFAESLGIYGQIVLIGYSMGGSLTLKYLGGDSKKMAHAPQYPPRPYGYPIRAGGGRSVPSTRMCGQAVRAQSAGAVSSLVSHGIAFSAPCHIQHSVDALEKLGNYLYKRKFYLSLSAKIRAKAQQFPEEVGRKIPHWPSLPDPQQKRKNRGKMPIWRQFDEQFSAPLNGFETAEDFYAYASAANFMEDTQVPVLLVNALNDPIIPQACTPWELADKNPLITIEAPRRGGHVGFHLRGEKRYTWMELRAEAFINGKSAVL